MSGFRHHSTIQHHKRMKNISTMWEERTILYIGYILNYSIKMVLKYNMLCNLHFYSTTITELCHIYHFLAQRKEMLFSSPFHFHCSKITINTQHSDELMDLVLWNVHSINQDNRYGESVEFPSKTGAYQKFPTEVVYQTLKSRNKC